MTRRIPAFITLTFTTLMLTCVWATPAQSAIPTSLLTSDQPTLAPMLDQVLPAVVNVMVTGKPQQRAANPLFNDPFFRRFFGEPGQQGPQQGPQGEAPRGLGSGVIVDADKGIVLTNAHVVADAEEIQIRLNDDREFEAEIVGSDPESDIAVLKIKDAGSLGLAELSISNSDSLRVGDFVVAIGNPFGLRQTVTSGIVSGLGRHGLGKRYEDFIQTDASINPGNSGGALVNLNGELVGINTAILSRSGGNIGIGFAIPSNLAQSTLGQILKFGEVRRGRLGVVGQDLTNELAKAFDLDVTQGVVVAQVVEDSAADKAGIEERDVIISVNDSPIRDFGQLANAIGLRQPGEKVQIKLLRDGKEKTIKATLSEQSEIEASAEDESESDELFGGLAGARFGSIPEDHPLAGQVQGVAVLAIAPASPAARAGLQPGDIIASANRQEVSSLKELKAIAGPDTEQLLLRVRRGRGALFLLIR